MYWLDLGEEMKLFREHPSAFYWLIAVVLLLASPLLACGVSAALPTQPTDTPTEQPTESAPVKTGVIVVWVTPSHVWVVCAENVNARAIAPDMTVAVTEILSFGQSVVLTGEEIQIAGETWQPTNKGLVDPKYLCEVK